MDEAVTVGTDDDHVCGEIGGFFQDDLHCGPLDEEGSAIETFCPQSFSQCLELPMFFVEMIRDRLAHRDRPHVEADEVRIRLGGVDEPELGGVALGKGPRLGQDRCGRFRQIQGDYKVLHGICG